MEGEVKVPMDYGKPEEDAKRNGCKGFYPYTRVPAGEACATIITRGTWDAPFANPEQGQGYVRCSALFVPVYR